MCVYVCVCMCVHVCVCACTCVRACVRAYVHRFPTFNPVRNPFAYGYFSFLKTIFDFQRKWTRQKAISLYQVSSNDSRVNSIDNKIDLLTFL